MKISVMKGDRTRYVATFDPIKALASEQLYINIAKMSVKSCLVPRSLHLCYRWKLSNTKSWFLNNLSKLLQERLQVKVAGEIAYCYS